MPGQISGWPASHGSGEGGGTDLPALCGSQRWSRRLCGLVVGVAGDPGIDLGPGSLQPRSHLVGVGKVGSGQQNGADEELPVGRQLPPGPCPPVRAKAVVGEHQDIGVGCSGQRSGGTAGVWGQRVGRRNARLAARIWPVERSSAIAVRHRGKVKFAPSGKRSIACPPASDAARS